MIGRSNPPKRGTRINLSHPIFRDLVAYWPIQESAGVIVPDASGRGRNGTLKNMDPSTDWAVANRGAALDFDGTDDFVDFGNVLNPGTKDFSISYRASIRNTDAQAYRVIQKRGSGAFGTVGGFVIGSSGSGGGAFAGSIDRAFVDDGAGNYVALRYDGLRLRRRKTASFRVHLPQLHGDFQVLPGRGLQSDGRSHGRHSGRHERDRQPQPDVRLPVGRQRDEIPVLQRSSFERDVHPPATRTEGNLHSPCGALGGVPAAQAG